LAKITDPFVMRTIYYGLLYALLSYGIAAWGHDGIKYTK
jgi:hypothetical protein